MRGQFADFKAKFRTELNRKFPPVRKEIDEKKLEFSAVGEVVQHTFSTRKMVAFRGIGLLFVMIGFMLYSTLSYLYLVIAAGIISLALEGVVTFWTRFTRHRGLGILITYLIFIFFLVSGFIIVIPFLVGRGTQILQSIMTHVQGIQHDIMVQGMDVYVRGLRRVPDFLNDDILLYIENTDSASLLQSLMDNLGNIVNLSSSYLKTIGGYAVNIFGNIFSTLGKLIIFLTLSIFFSVSHYEVKYGIKYLFRKTPKSKEKVDEVYEGVASRLKSELLLCLIIGIACYL